MVTRSRLTFSNAKRGQQSLPCRNWLLMMTTMNQAWVYSIHNLACSSSARSCTMSPVLHGERLEVYSRSTALRHCLVTSQNIVQKPQFLAQIDMSVFVSLVSLTKSFSIMSMSIKRPMIHSSSQHCKESISTGSPYGEEL